jgi:hypothetical protein
VTRLSHRARLNQFSRRAGALDVIRRKRGPGTALPTSEDAQAWAKQQPWWPRVVEAGNVRDYWIWKIEKP